jgi:cytochrome c-type biogenesis protein CcmF
VPVTATLGSLGVLVAAVSAVVLAVRGFLAVGRPELASADRFRIPALGVLGGGLLAMLALEMGLLADDFSIEYIANNSAEATPFIYKVASAWASLEGSLVLWGLVLAAFVFAVWLGVSRKDEVDQLGAVALGVLGVVTAFFFGMMLTVSNPFEVCTQIDPRFAGCFESSGLPWTESVAAPAGRGPNPLLQNHPLMAVHPPMLYVGYVGLTVPFAFAIGSLLIGRRGDEWLRRTMTWTRVAWVFLTAGIVLGGLWSYEVLGWGGYWAWDPVENASFFPWLVATAFFHSAAVQMRRGALQAWNYVLVILTFSLTILGTFLTRSGVIQSVHAFTQSSIGPVLLWFLMLVLVGSLGLFAMRSYVVSSAPRLDSLFSREGMILINNLLLSVFAFVVLVGTLYPMVVEAVTGDEVGVGRPFFDRMAIPIGLALALLMAVGPVVPYRKASVSVVWGRVRNPLRFALGTAALAVLLGVRNGWIIIAILLAAFVTGVAVRQLWDAARRRSVKTGRHTAAEAVRVMRGDSPYWGGQIGHIGYVVLLLGIALSSNLSQEGAFDLSPGDSAEFAGYTITYSESFTTVKAQRTEVGADIELRRGGHFISTLEPKLNFYPGSQSPIASPSVDTGLRGDFYISLASIDLVSNDGTTDPNDRIRIETFWRPFIWLVWAGGFLVAGGAVFAWAVRKPARTKEAVGV